jgi:hypothetical protein
MKVGVDGEAYAVSNNGVPGGLCSVRSTSVKLGNVTGNRSIVHCHKSPFS